MKKRLLSILLLCCMVLTMLPTAAFAEDNTEESPVCTCETVCTAETMNTECSVCGADGALPESCAKANTGAIAEGAPAQALTSVDITFPAPEADKPVGDGSAVSANADSGLTLYLFGPALWKQGEEPDKLDENATYAEGNTYLLNFTFYTQKPITDETVLTYNGKPITRYADYPALTEALDAYDGTQDAYLGCVLFSAEGTGDPAMEDLKDLYLLSLYAFVRVPEAQIPEDTVDEQFTLAPGGRYYFDLSAMNIPGKVNGGLPDSTLHYVPFTYAGTIEAYKLTSEMATTEEYAQKNKYPHSLFVADYAVTHTVSWDDLNTAGLIFGKDYAAGGVGYTLRAPSCGSGFTDSGDSERGTPQSNEWDAVLNKNSGYIQNWNQMYSWGQDAYFGNASDPAVRGYYSARTWSLDSAAFSTPNVGFRPVLEVLNSDTLGSGGLKVVTLDLGGGTLGNSSEDIQIIVKTGSEFTAPASDGLTRPDGNTGSYFMWLGSNGKLYAPGASVPADVTKLTAQFALSEQFSLKPGGTYYFDLSAMGIPGTVNDALPDNTLHYVPFTYAGTVDAYKLTSARATTEEYAQQNKYAHSLFVADYDVTHKVNWNNLDTASLIFGKNYASGGVDYTLRAPSVGSISTGSGDSQRGVPQSNEWDTMLNKNSGYIQNWNKMYSWGQDTSSYELLYRAGRGYKSARFWNHYYATNSYPLVGFRPVLEVLNADTLGSGGLKVVTLDLGGGTLGNSSEEIQIIVKSSESFAAPASDGLNRPAGDTGSYFMWLGSNGKLYAPGDSVPADVTKLTAQFALSEQFSLAPGGRYYFDLSAMDIPGTVNSNLPDSTLHYVPFTYAGTVDAYSMENETDTAKQPYEHSLFIADYNVKCSLQRETLAEMNLIYGQTYTASNVNYTLRAPSVGDHHRNEGEGSGLAPIDNEWDTIYQKSADYIKNWYKMRSFGQDIGTGNVEGMYLSRGGHFAAQATFWARPTLPERDIGFRPVLEVPNPGTLGADGLKAVTLNLGGGKLGGSSDAIHIIVKNGSKFTAPASGGLTRPAGDTGSYFMWLDGNGNSYEPGGSVPADVTTLTVQWTAPTYAVTLHTNGGTINNGNVTEYTYGVGAALPTDVTRTGYTFKGWYDNEGLTGDPVTAIGNTETGNKEYWAKWEINQYTITYDLAGGTAEGNPDTYTIETRTFTLKNPTKSGYTFTGWSGTGLDGENNMTVTIPTGSTGNRTYTAHWRYNGSGHSYSYYTIKATAGTGGSISPSGNVSVREGRDQTFTITPDKGYAVANVKIDGKSIGAVKSYTFENVRRTHTIEVIFMKANGNPQTGVFVDVATGSYYEDAVDWAVENGITKGTDDTHFSPDGICTRAQAVTFLWRAAGSPEPETRTMPFTDVPAGSYYYDAVLWAVENGITKGTSETMFSPDATCSRAQIVAFLWRSEKSPAAGTANPFADVKSTAYYAGAVLWAVKEDITKGTTNTTFSPDADCTRAQIVTFLWRCKK